MEEEVENFEHRYGEFGEEMPPLLFDEKMLLDQRASKCLFVGGPCAFLNGTILMIRKVEKLGDNEKSSMPSNRHGGVEGYVLANNRIIISTVVTIKEFPIEHI